MAEEGRQEVIDDPEVNALLNAEGIDTEKIIETATKKGGKLAGAPKAQGGNPPPDNSGKNPDPNPDPKKDVPTPEAIRTAMLNEMFGDRFKTVEEVKNANILAALQERDTLRGRVTELETQVKAKPKTQFVNEDIAKMNEFIRETGIKDVGLFYKLNATDIANMSDIDALVMQHIIENPSLATKEPQVRRYIETKYNVDSKKVEAGDLTEEELETNLIGVSSDAAKAKAKILELKGKIKMPEPPADDVPEGGKKKWTPEIEAKQKTQWESGSSKVVEAFSSIAVPIEGSEKPAINFEIPGESKKEIAKAIYDYAINNQMEVTEDNVRAIAVMAYSDLIMKNWAKINRELINYARGLSQEQYLKEYHNPSGKKNSDTPPGEGDDTSDEAKRRKAFEAEMGR